MNCASGACVNEGMTPCLGTYKLLPSMEVNGCPVWRHCTNRIYHLAFTGVSWSVQLAQSLGTQNCLLALRGPRCASPDLATTQTWEIANGRQGLAQ